MTAVGLAGLASRFVEKIEDAPRRLVVDAGHPREVGERGALDLAQGAEVAQERTLAGRTDARDLLQARLANVALAPRAVRADGETVRLVAQPLHEVKHRVARRQLEARLSGHMERLAPGVTIRPL